MSNRGFIRRDLYRTHESIIRDIGGDDLILWMDARHSTLNNNDLVSTLENYGSFNNILTQTTASKQPLFKKNESVGNSLAFDGAGDCLEVGSINISSTNAVTICTISKANVSGSSVVFEMSPVYLSNSGSFLVSRSLSVPNGYIVAHKGDAALKTKIPTTGFSGYSCQISRHNMSEPAATEIKLFVNKAEPTVTENNPTANNTINFSTFPCWIGSRNNGASLSLNGNISLILIFKRALTDNEMLKVSGAAMNLFWIYA